MTEWTAERLDALPEGTLIEADIIDTEQFVHIDGRWCEVGHIGSYTSAELAADQNPGGEPEYLPIRLISVPVEALLTQKALDAWRAGPIDPDANYAEIVVRGAIAHITGRHPMPDLVCIDARSDSNNCQGGTEYRTPLSGTGISYPRCDWHWHQRLDRQAQIEARYPDQAPADFDPTYAGEQWDDDAW